MQDMVSNNLEELFSFSVQYNHKKDIHVICIQCSYKSFHLSRYKVYMIKARIMNFKRHNIQKVIYD